MEKKGNLTPDDGIPAHLRPDQGGQSGAQRSRRSDARRGVSDKLTVSSLPDGTTEGALLTSGWVLNISRHGLRAILEERVLAGVDYEVTVGEEGTSQLTRRARVVWVQEENDGVVVGLEFLSPMSSTLPAAPALELPVEDGAGDGGDDDETK